MTRLTNLIKEVLSTPPSINEGLSVTEEPAHEATITFKKHSEINIYPDMSSDGRFPTPYKKGDTEKVKKIKDKGRHYEVYFMDGDFAKIDKDLIIVKEPLNEYRPKGLDENFLQSLSLDPKLTATKFFVSFRQNNLDISNPKVKAYVEKTLTNKRVKEEFYKLLAGKGARGSVNETTKKLTYNDFVQMVRDDMMAGASPDEKPSDEQVKRRAKVYYNDYLQGTSVDDLFESKKKDCNCGCNTCENVGNPGVLLNESIAPKQILSENLRYHVQNKLPLTENTFRYGSESFINLWAEARALYLREIIHVNDDDKEILTETDLGNYGIYEGKKVPLGLPMENVVSEAAKKKKKNPPLGKPKRGGSKAYYVYVRDPKTKRIKKVSFGSGGLKAKINNPKARKAFAARHKCAQKKDRTKASYWSCRLPRYAKLLGLKSSFSGFW